MKYNINYNDTRVFKAEIEYTIDKKHPDIEYIKDWERGKKYTFDDAYFMDKAYWGDDREAMINHIKRDLRLVAGGGYDSDHIHCVKFNIKETFNY